MSKTFENELYHYGVRGMKWGIRKALNDYKQFKEHAGRRSALKERHGYQNATLPKKHIEKHIKPAIEKHHSGMKNKSDYEKARSNAGRDYLGNMYKKKAKINYDTAFDYQYRKLLNRKKG